MTVVKGVLAELVTPGPAVPAAGDHGGDGVRLARALGLDPSLILDLSMSLNPLAPDPTPTLASHLDSLSRYPDTTDATLALADAIGVERSRLLLTNGGAEAIALVGAELRRGWVDEPDFSLYRRHLEALEVGAPRFRSNPHNPTGRLAGAGESAEVWDEAFYPLATGLWTRGDADSGAIVVGSLTKILACPGLRLGYVLGPDEDLVSGLAARQPRWSVGAVAAAALPQLLESVDLASWARGIAALRGQLSALLVASGLRPRPSDASYMLVDGGAGLREALAPHGVVVRDCASFGMPGSVRIAVPDARGLERLEGALGRAIASGWSP